MYIVICPTCKESREVKILKKNANDIPCKKCCQIGKPKTDNHRKKLSESLKEFNTEEECLRKSEYMKSHPERWEGKIRGKDSTHKHSEETKAKIGEGVSKTVKERNENESE